MAEGAANALVDQLLRSVCSLVRGWTEQAVNDATHVRTSCAEQAVILRDAEAAAAAMNVHMNSADRRPLAAVAAGGA